MFDYGDDDLEQSSLLPTSTSAETLTSSQLFAIVLEKSQNISRYFVAAVTIGELELDMISTVWILFAKTLPDYTNTILSIVVVLRQIVRVVALLLCSYFADRYGFDLVICITSTLVAIGLLLACSSFSIVQFSIAILIEAIAGFEIEILGVAFVGKLLPLRVASIYYGYITSFGGAAGLVGVLLAGILASYTADSYRTVLFFVFGLSLVRWVGVLYFIRDTQSQLVQQQLQLVEFYQRQDAEADMAGGEIESAENNAERFPLCIEQMRNTSSTTTEPKTYLYFFVSESLENKSLWYVLDLMLHIYMFNMNSIYEAFLVWLYVYLVERFNTTLFIASCVVAVGCVAYVCFALAGSKFATELLLINKYLLLMTNCAARVSVLLIGIVWNVDDKYSYYLCFIWVVFIGGGWGLGNVVTQSIIFEQQPPRDSSKIAGIKTVAKYSYIAIITGVLASYWDYGTGYHVFGFAFAVCDMLCIIVLLVMICVKVILYGNRFSARSVQ